MGQQAAARWGDPFELAGELHALGVAVAGHRAPLVVRAAGPRARGQPGIGRHARKLRVVPEDVELPRGGRVGAEHVALKAHAVHEVSNGRLGAGEVGVRFVVGAAHHLDAAVGDEPAQVGTVLGMGVPVRLEVVHLGEHELVLGLTPGHLEVGAHQIEPVGLTAPAGRVLGPHAGVGRLGVPPHGVVVEVADHVHRPAGLGDGEHERRAASPASTRAVRCSPDDRPVTATGTSTLPSPGSARGLAPSDHRPRHGRSRRTAGVGDPHQLQRRVRRPDEQLRRLRGDDVHAKTLRRSAAAKCRRQARGDPRPATSAPQRPLAEWDRRSGCGPAVGLVGRERRRLTERPHAGPSARRRRGHVEVAHEYPRAGETAQVSDQ